GHLGGERGVHQARGQLGEAAPGPGRRGGYDVVDRCDPGRQRGDGGLVRDVRTLDADIHAAIGAGQIVRVTPGGDNPSAVVGYRYGDGPGNTAAAADDQHGFVFQRGHLLLSSGGAN